MVDKAKEALERVKAERERSGVQAKGSPEEVADDDNRHRTLKEMPQPNPNRPTQTEVSGKTRAEMEAGAKAVGERGGRRETDQSRLRQSGRTMVTETDGTPVETDADGNPVNRDPNV